MRRGSCRTLAGAILGLDASDFDCVRQIHFDRLRREVELALRNHNDLGSHKQIPSGHACNKHSSPYAQPSPLVDLARPGMWRNLDLLAPDTSQSDGRQIRLRETRTRPPRIPTSQMATSRPFPRRHSALNTQRGSCCSTTRPSTCGQDRHGQRRDPAI